MSRVYAVCDFAKVRTNFYTFIYFDKSDISENEIDNGFRMETELFAAVTAGELDKVKELLKKETKETIDQVID